MAQTTPQIGLGSKVELATAGNSPTFAIFGFVSALTGPSESNPLVDATHMQSVAREWIYGIPEGGEITVESHYAADHPTHNTTTGIISMERNRITALLRITSPGASNSETYTCLVTKCDRTFNMDQVMKISATFKITGAIVVAPAS